MSKKAKAASKQRRLQQKRNQKAANRARYAELRRLGQNGKSVRSLRNNKVSKLAKAHSHKDGFCGNPACRRCFKQTELGIKKVA